MINLICAVNVSLFPLSYSFKCNNCCFPSSVSMLPDATSAIQFLRGFTNKPLTATDCKASHDQGKSIFKDLRTVIAPLSLVDLNYVLYRCDNEEQVDRPGNGVYNMPGYGPLIYCGLQGERMAHKCNNYYIVLLLRYTVTAGSGESF